MKRAAAWWLFLGCLGTASAQEANVQLREGAGKDQVVANCSACHSLDYVLMNSPFPNRKLWEAEVNKMIKVFGASIAPQDAAAIVDYLTKHYGTQ